MSLLSTTYKVLFTILPSRLSPYAKDIFGLISVDFDAEGQILMTYSEFVKYVKKWDYNETVH